MKFETSDNTARSGIAIGGVVDRPASKVVGLFVGQVFPVAVVQNAISVN